VAKAIRPETRLLFIESPTNPLLSVIDIRHVAEIGKARGIRTAIDNTFATPINQNPLALGIDIVLHSGTKYLGGHSDLCCGAALASRDLCERTCHLLERSLKTLSLRVERQTENAQQIAEHLRQHQRIQRVYYPGLAAHPGQAIARSQMKGFGAMLSFELQPGFLDCTAFQKKLQLIKPALSLGGVESTICAPATTSHQKMSPAERERIGVSDSLLRLSVGIEHVADLIADLDQALQ
jgi:cystathionine beta-lyase